MLPREESVSKGRNKYTNLTASISAALLGSTSVEDVSSQHNAVDQLEGALATDGIFQELKTELQSEGTPLTCSNWSTADSSWLSSTPSKSKFKLIVPGGSQFDVLYRSHEIIDLLVEQIAKGGSPISVHHEREFSLIECDDNAVDTIKESLLTIAKSIAEGGLDVSDLRESVSISPETPNVALQTTRLIRSTLLDGNFIETTDPELAKRDYSIAFAKNCLMNVHRISELPKFEELLEEEEEDVAGDGFLESITHQFLSVGHKSTRDCIQLYYKINDDRSEEVLDEMPVLLADLGCCSSMLTNCSVLQTLQRHKYRVFRELEEEILRSLEPNTEELRVGLISFGGSNYLAVRWDVQYEKGTDLVRLVNALHASCVSKFQEFKPTRDLSIRSCGERVVESVNIKQYLAHAKKSCSPGFWDEDSSCVRLNDGSIVELVFHGKGTYRITIRPEEGATVTDYTEGKIHDLGMPEQSSWVAKFPSVSGADQSSIDRSVEFRLSSCERGSLIKDFIVSNLSGSVSLQDGASNSVSDRIINVLNHVKRDRPLVVSLSRGWLEGGHLHRTILSASNAGKRLDSPDDFRIFTLPYARGMLC